MNLDQDYRDFLRDRFESERRRNPSVSFQYCATRLNTSKSYLKLVIDKKRHVTLDRISGIASLLNFTSEERQLLTFLFLRDTTKTKGVREYFDQILCAMSTRRKYGHPTAVPESAPAMDPVFASWLHMALHSLTKVKGFRLDLGWMRARLGEDRVTAEEVGRAWSELIAIGAVVVEDGRAKANGFVFRNADPLDPKRFEVYRVGVDKTAEVLRTGSASNPRGHYMMSVSLSAKDAELAREKFFRLRDELLELSKTSTDRETILFVSNNMFNVLEPEPSLEPAVDGRKGASLAPQGHELPQ